MNLLLLDLLQMAHGHRCIFELKCPSQVCSRFASLLPSQHQYVWSVRTVMTDKNRALVIYLGRAFAEGFPITDPY